MVLKRQYYGFNGFRVPSFPKGRRSSRGRGLLQKNGNENQICAIELLASLAGKLLQESESSSASSNASEAIEQPAVGNVVIKREQSEDAPLKPECFDLGSSEESICIPALPSPDNDRKFLQKVSQNNASDSILGHSSVISNSDISDKISKEVKPIICTNKIKCEALPVKVDGGSPNPIESCGGNVDSGFGGQQQADVLETGDLATGKTSNSKDPVELCVQFPALNTVDKNTKSSLFTDPIQDISFKRRADFKLGLRDNDENFSSCCKPVNKSKALRPPSRIGDRRIRKLLTSKYWKLAPKLRDYENPRAALDGEVKPLYRKRKYGHKRERYHQDNLYKRRKFSDDGLIIASDGGLSSESVCNSPEKGMIRDKNGTSAMFHRADGLSSSVIGHQSSIHSKESHVKFSIKSFRIPELYIEVPETATVGSLKRTVLEAVTAILGGGLRVGVLFHGKKVRDDNRTLLQTGITSEENLNTLGFSLEPSPIQPSTIMCNEDPPASLPCETPLPISRSPASPALDLGISDELADPPPLTDSGNNIESNHESFSSLTDLLTDRTLPDSRALVPVPHMSAEALAVVPLNQKPRRTEVVQRRTRRPFSVSEVEALVRAVEELGTGRWRDVKLRSFENADHRTYVDLKDKWKTLVHTAKIAPQQRRGEPVPQELLDRVLAAHAYWSQSQYQAKQHSKSQAAILKIADGPNV